MASLNAEDLDLKLERPQRQMLKTAKDAESGEESERIIALCRRYKLRKLSGFGP
jgi:hypothetical protein